MNTLCPRTGERCPAAEYIYSRKIFVEQIRDIQLDETAAAMEMSEEAQVTGLLPYDETSFAELDKVESGYDTVGAILAHNCGQKPPGIFRLGIISCAEVARQAELRLNEAKVLSKNYI